MIKSINILIAASLIGFTSCEKNEKVEPTNSSDTWIKTLAEYNNSTQGLKDYYNNIDYFEIGGAIEPSSVDNSAEITLIRRHISSLTAENAMKWSSIQQTEGNFNFINADKIVSFAQANNIKVRGHCLVWHQQVPGWVFKDGASTVSKAVLLERMKTHITTVVNHFKGKVYAWDVVNEAIDDGANKYKSTNWYDICGEDFIFEAFKAARAADPNAKLFYNDYSETNPTKRDKIYELLQKLKAQNLVDGMGMQGHWNIDAPTNENIIAAFDKYSSLGIEIHITELDVSVYPNAEVQSAYTPIIALKLSDAYNRYFTLFRSYKDKISSITFWGLADNHTWLDNFPVKGRKNYPLLFDQNYIPKQAYFKVIGF